MIAVTVLAVTMLAVTVLAGLFTVLTVSAAITTSVALVVTVAASNHHGACATVHGRDGSIHIVPLLHHAVEVPLPALIKYLIYV
jgi:cytochrome c553